jgi:hypothetical protein
VVSVVVGLRKMSISRLGVFLMISKSRKLTYPLVPWVGLSCMLLWIELAYCSIALGLVRVESYIILMSSSYLE